MVETIDNILKNISKGEKSKTVQRFKYELNITNAIGAVIKIGKAKNKKFKIDDDNRFVYENLIKWLFGQEFLCHDIKSKQPGKKPKIAKGIPNAGLYIAGNTGSGKSWAADIISVIASIDPIKSVFGESVRSMSYASYRTDDICSDFAHKGNIEVYKNLPIVCFHDLCSDSEPEESLYMGNRLKVMQSILESRGDRKDKITVITSNVPFTNSIFQERYSDRVVSRMFEMCNYFELTGKDRRIE